MWIRICITFSMKRLLSAKKNPLRVEVFNKYCYCKTTLLEFAGAYTERKVNNDFFLYYPCLFSYICPIFQSIIWFLSLLFVRFKSMSLQSSRYGCVMLYTVNVEKERLFLLEKLCKLLTNTQGKIHLFIIHLYFPNCKTATVQKNATLVYFGLCEVFIVHKCVLSRTHQLCTLLNLLMCQLILLYRKSHFLFSWKL